MTIAFHDIDPYEVLQVDKDASPIEIKKAYKKLCLQYHPDKLQQQNQTEEDSERFPKLQFAYSILSDAAKRSRYDQTGFIGEVENDDGFDWKEYFDSINNKITIDMIEEDRAKYQESEEEREDVITNFMYYEGDFLKLFEVIPHLEFTEAQENRIFNIIEEELANSEDVDVNTIKSWEKYKKSRKTKVRQMLKKLAKEAKEAAALEKAIKDKGKRNLQKKSDLASLIKSRQTGRLDSLIDSLESKYVGKGKKRSKDIDDDEFERIQQGLKKKKN